MTASKLVAVLRGLGNPEIAEHSQRFFKTGKGEYGEGDVFLGIRVPELRKVARAYADMPLAQVLKALASKYHEVRLCAVLVLVRQFERGDPALRRQIFDAYLDNTEHINNWDIVDSSAHQIVGGYLVDGDRRLLDSLAKSNVLWERRIAIIATLHFIRNNEFDDTLRIAERLLGDTEDLMHKAVGWMLREVGNRAPIVERAFLKPRYKSMPRTMLRYAIEKFPEDERQAFLRGDI